MQMFCQLCKGTFGQANSRTGDHFVCEVRKSHGLPTPCLGITCEVCGGSGIVPGFHGGVMLDLRLGPFTIARAISAQFPPCTNCGGKGYTKREEAA